MAVAANLLMVVLELLGLYQVRSKLSWKLVVFYTQLSNLIAFGTSLLFLFLPAGQLALLRYLSTCMLMMTFCVTAFVLIPMGGSPGKLLFSGNGLYHHLLCPLLSFVSYLFFEEHVTSFWAALLPAGITLVYGLTMVALNAKRLVDGPYPFFRVHQQSVSRNILWMIALILLVSGLSMGIACF